MQHVITDSMCGLTLNSYHVDVTLTKCYIENLPNTQQILKVVRTKVIAVFMHHTASISY